MQISWRGGFWHSRAIQASVLYIELVLGWIHRSYRWPQTEPQFRYTEKYIGWLCGFKPGLGARNFQFLFFPSSVCRLIPMAPSLCWHTGNDTAEVMTCKQIVHGSFSQLAVPEALGILVSDCTLFTAEALSCFGHMPPNAIGLPKHADTKHYCAPQ